MRSALATETVAIVVGTGLALLLYVGLYDQNESEPDSHRAVALLEAKTDVANRSNLNKDLAGSHNNSTQNRAVEFSRYPSAVLATDDTAEAANGVRNLGTVIDPNDPIIDYSNSRTNIGDWIDPDDENSWLLHESSSIRNIGDFLDPDDP